MATKKPTHLTAFIDIDDETWTVDVHDSYVAAERAAIGVIEDGIQTEVYVCEIGAMVTEVPPKRPLAIVTKVKN